MPIFSGFSPVLLSVHWRFFSWIRVITKLLNTEQSSKGKGKTHKSTNRQNQSTTGKLGKLQWPWLGTGISKDIKIKLNLDERWNYNNQSWPTMWDRTIPLESSQKMWNLRVELSDLTLLTISDYFFSHYSANHKIFMSKSTMAVIEKTSKLCGLMKSKYNIQNDRRYK